MMTRKFMMLAYCIVLAAGMAAVGCSDDDDVVDVVDDAGTDTDTDTDTDADTDTDTDTDTDSDTDGNYEITVEVTVPAGFSATPDRLVGVYFDSPTPTSPMPDGIGETIEDVTILPDGDYWMHVVLYVEGGGTMGPTPGVDWAKNIDTMITFPATDTIDLGTVELALVPFEADAGPDSGK